LYRLDLSRHLQEGVITEMRSMLHQTRSAQKLIRHYEEATGSSKSQLLRDAARSRDPRQALKICGRREKLTDIAARIKEAQKTINQVERKA
jgi:hypothetical protein